ncbi:MAG: hypothetical protein ACR2JO_13035 [Mycobacteriales bacterium]
MSVSGIGAGCSALIRARTSASDSGCSFMRRTPGSRAVGRGEIPGQGSPG